MQLVYNKICFQISFSQYMKRLGQRSTDDQFISDEARKVPPIFFVPESSPLALTRERETDSSKGTPSADADMDTAIRDAIHVPGSSSGAPTGNSSKS
jgi:hypothetical protein